jgi:predicted ester cyclase
MSSWTSTSPTAVRRTARADRRVAQFRRAVPDLTLAVPEAWVIEDQVLARLTFTGHFTGEFAGHPGDDREIRFEAIDMYTIRDGHIVANWHLEDNLTLLKQLVIVSSP